MIISLTGANGFIGNNLLMKLLSHNHTVKVLSTQSVLHESVSYYKGNFSSPDNILYEFLKGSDVIINCAGEILEEKKMQSTNVHGVKRLLNIINNKKLDIKFLQLSSAGVYKKNIDLIHYEYLDEKNKEYSNNIYEQSKLDGEKEIIANSGRYLILRPTAIFSKNMTNNSLRNLIKYVKKGLFFYIGEKDSMLSYLHLDDLTDTIVNIIHLDHFNNRIYNLSNDTKLEDTINSITNNLNIKTVDRKINRKLYKILNILSPRFLKLPISNSIYNALTSKTIIDSSLAKNELRFKPKRDLHDCINELIK